MDNSLSNALKNVGTCPSTWALRTAGLSRTGAEINVIDLNENLVKTVNLMFVI
jgi:hypothetical protein